MHRPIISPLTTIALAESVSLTRPARRNRVTATSATSSTAAAQTPAIDVRNLVVAYRGGREVLRGVHLTVTPGECCVVVGPNGGGKTTLFRAILGLLEIRSGSLHIFGRSPREGRRLVGYLPQHNRVDPDFPLHVRDVVAMGLLGPATLMERLRRVLRGQNLSAAEEQVVTEVLASVNLAGFEDRRLGELSGGQMQRVFLARALACRPRILLLDEPAAHLDPRTSDSLYELLRDLRRNDTTIVLSSHDPGDFAGDDVTVVHVDGVLSAYDATTAHRH